MSTPGPNAQNPYAPPTAHVEDVAETSSPGALAERGTRLGAYLIDAVILAIVEGPVIWGVIQRLGQSGFGAIQGLSRLAIYKLLYVGNPGMPYTVGLFVIWAAITIPLVARNGQSIGKRLVGIKVLRMDGSKASFWRIFLLRNVVNGIPALIPVLSLVYGLVDILMIFTESRQCLHDRIARTLVVKA